MTDEAKCPVVHATAAKGGASNRDWWPNQLNLKILQQNVILILENAIATQEKQLLLSIKMDILFMSKQV